MFTERKDDSAEAAMKVILEGESESSKGMRLLHKHTTVAQHHAHARHHDSMGLDAHQNADDAHTEARIALKRGDKNGFLDKHDEERQHRSAAGFHEHNSMRHRMEAHVKAGHKVEDFLG